MSISPALHLKTYFGCLATLELIARSLAKSRSLVPGLKPTSVSVTNAHSTRQKALTHSLVSSCDR